MILTVKVRPNARQNAVISWEDAATMVIDIKAPAREGKANRELIKFLAQHFGVAKSLVDIRRGQGGRVKHIAIPDGTDLKN